MATIPTFSFHTQVLVRSKRPATRDIDGLLGYVAGISERPDESGHFEYAIFLYDLKRAWCCEEAELESTGEVDDESVRRSEEQARRLASKGLCRE